MSVMSAVSLNESVKEGTYKLSDGEKRKLDAIRFAAEDIAQALLLYCELVKKGEERKCLAVVTTGSDECKYHFSEAAFDLLGIEDKGGDRAEQVRKLLEILQTMGIYKVPVYSSVQEDGQHFYLAQFGLTERRLHKPVASVLLGEVLSKLDPRREILSPVKK